MKKIVLFCFLSTISFSVNADAFKFLKHSCNSEKYAEACFKMANIYRKKSKNKDSKIYYKRGCDLGHTKCCNQRKIPKLIVKSLYKKRNRSIASIDTDIIAATKHIKDTGRRIKEIANHYCKFGSTNACQSLKCGMDQIKNPECKEYFKKGYSNMNKAVENPMKYLLENKKHFSQEEFENYKTGVLRLKEILKKCKMGMESECIIDGERIEASKELMIIGSEVNNLQTLIYEKKCNKNDVNACFAKDMISVSAEAIGKLKDLDI